LIAGLERRLLSLPCHGIEVFRAGGLIDPLKAAARARWIAFFEDDAGERAYEDGAGGLAENFLNVSVDPNAIFYDGFELGTKAAWSETVP